MVRIVAVVVAVVAVSSVVQADPINAAIGDASWIATRREPAELAGETERIRTHLAFVHDRLARVAGLPPHVQARRDAALATLARYVARGEFPRRRGDRFAGRRPRFIDDRGVRCAVGELIWMSGEPELARAIARDHEYALVRDMHAPALVAWAADHGFTLDELAMIQPGYQSPPSERGMRYQIEASADQLVMSCVKAGAFVERVQLHVVGDSRGRATATTKTAGAFATCIATRTSELETGGGAYNPSPKPYSFDITLRLPGPQQIVERRLAAMVLEDDGCAPRPGPLARELTIDVGGGTVRATTSPDNTEVDACFAARVGRGLGALVEVNGVRAHRRVVLRSRIQTKSIEDNARYALASCYRAGASPANARVRVTARVDDREFAIAIEPPGEPFAKCARELLADRLRRSFAVTRDTGNGRNEQYFRADADVSVAVNFDVAAEAAKLSRQPPAKPPDIEMQ